VEDFRVLCLSYLVGCLHKLCEVGSSSSMERVFGAGIIGLNAQAPKQRRGHLVTRWEGRDGGKSESMRARMPNIVLSSISRALSRRSIWPIWRRPGCTIRCHGYKMADATGR
jgi:hypothetical protein